MKSRLSFYVKSIFIACGIALVAYFFAYDTCEEYLIYQNDAEIHLKFHSEKEMDLTIHLNYITFVSDMRVSTHTFSAGDQILKIPLHRNFEIEKIYFTTNPIDAKFAISEISFQSNLLSKSWTKDALLEIIEPLNPQELQLGTMVVLKNKSLQFSLSRAVPFGIVKGKFSKNMYGFIQHKIAIISLIVFLFAFSISLYFLIKSRIIENVSSNTLFISFTFVLLIILPFFSKKDSYTKEKRTLAEFPDLDQLIWNIPNKYTKYFNDHFPYRTQLSLFSNFIHIGILHTSTRPDLIRIGKEGWLFGYHKINTDKYRGEVLYTEEELARIQYNLEEKEKWLESQGSKFYLLVLPMKHDMYPEYLPPSMIPRSNVNQRTQILDYLQDNSHIKLIDGHKAMFENKDNFRLYYKTDLHWNQMGGFYTYVALMKELEKDFPDLKTLSLDDYTIIQKHGDYSGDLLDILNTDTFFSRDPYFLKKKGGASATMNPYRPLLPQESDYTYFENENAPDIRLLVFRDSYSSYLIPHLSEGFSYSGYSWHTNVLPDRVKKVAPDVVVQEIMQIFLDELLEENPDIMKQKTSSD